MAVVGKTRFQIHVENWRNCKLCPLHSQRRRIVLARGKLPADVLFVGEAPGESEDNLGVPFIGPAGKLLDQIIARAMPDYGEVYQRPQLRLAFTNLVACFPRDAKRAGNHEPPVESIQACRPRLDELVEIANPRLVVLVGALSQKHYSFTPSVSITHPAAILRANVANQGLMIQRAVVTLAEAFADLPPF